MLNSDVLDTLVFKNRKIWLKDFHIDRTFEAYQLSYPQVSRMQILEIYSQLENKLLDLVSENEMLRLILSQNKFLDFSYEIVPKTPLHAPLRLDVMTGILNPNGLGLQNYKWTDRNRWAELLAAKNPQADDIVAINEEHHVTETSRFNLFFYHSPTDEVFTPTLKSGCIHGVYRRYVLNKKRIDLPGLGFKKLIEKDISVADLFSFSKIGTIYVANAARGVLIACLLTKNPTQTN